jgi:hypothetical protein
MMNGKNPDKSRTQGHAAKVPHTGTMSGGGSSGKKNAMTGAGGNKMRAGGTMGKHSRTSG